MGACECVCIYTHVSVEFICGTSVHVHLTILYYVHASVVSLEVYMYLHSLNVFCLPHGYTLYIVHLHLPSKGSDRHNRKSIINL